MRIALKPVDVLTLAFVGLLSALTLAFMTSIPAWGWIVGRYFMVALSLVALAAYTCRSDTWKPAVYLYYFLPVLIIPVIYDSIGDIIPCIRHYYFDDWLIGIDHAIFGVDPTVWMERLIRPWLTDTLQLAYTSYYFIPISLGVVLVAKRKHGEFDKAIFGIALCFYLSYAGYLIFPAVGPRFTLAHVQTTDLQASPFAAAIQNTLNGLENTKTDAFPSGHTAVVLTTLYYAWKSGEKKLFAVLLPVVAALIFSTVYLRYHYVIDVMAGMLLAAGTLWLAPGLYRRLSKLPDQPQDQLHNPT